MRQTRQPHMEGNISNVWTNRKPGLPFNYVEGALKTAINSQRIPITEKSDDIAKAKFFNGITTVKESMTTLFEYKQLKAKNEIQSVLVNNESKSVKEMEPESQAMLKDEAYVDEKELNLTEWEMSMIIFSSTLLVILVIISAATVIIKV